MTGCPTYLIDIGPNLLQVLVQVITLVTAAYGVTRVLANGQAAKTAHAALMANGHALANGPPK